MAVSLRVVTPAGAAFELACDHVVVPGADGELDLLGQHVALVSALKPGVMTVFADGKRSHYMIASGFVEIDEDAVTVLTGRCELASEIDVARAEETLAESTGALSDLGPGEPLYAKHRLRAARAQARIDASARR